MGWPASHGLDVKRQQVVTTSWRPAYDEQCRQLPVQQRLSIDESPTKETGAKSWLWTFVADQFTVFASRRTRAATVLDDLLTARFQGVVTCDRAKMSWQCGRLQWCWAPLKRDFQALIDSGDAQAKRLGHDLLRETREVFRH